MTGKKQISRVTRTKEQARKSYNRMSRWYDWMAGISEKKYRDAGLQKLEVQTGDLVLEIGFGTGQALLDLVKSVGGSGKVYGVDLSDGMHRIAESRILKQGFAERAELICGDGAKMPYAANSFNAVFICFTLELFDTPEIPVVLKECRRVLRRGGRICVVAMSKHKSENLMVSIYEWAHRTFPKFVDCRPIFVRESLEKEGFKITEVMEFTMWGLPVETVVGVKT